MLQENAKLRDVKLLRRQELGMPNCGGDKDWERQIAEGTRIGNAKLREGTRIGNAKLWRGQGPAGGPAVNGNQLSGLPGKGCQRMAGTHQHQVRRTHRFQPP